MKQYFQLQYKMLNRHLIDFGILPLFAYLFFAVLFFYGSNQLFARFELAAYIYIFIGLSVVSKASNKKRNDFLKLSFPSKKYFNIRIVENILFISPFVFFLIFKEVFIFGIVLLVLAILLSFIKIAFTSNFTIPTPFKKYPFEFTEGFRKTFFVFPIACFLTFKGVESHNFNLGIFSLVVIFGLCISYFSKTEKPYYVWLFNKSSKDFLYYKVKIAFIYVFLLSLPIVLILGIFFPSEIIILIAVQLIGYVYLTQTILAKYSVFPSQMSLPTAIILFLSISFPPFVFITFGYFYKEAIKKINSVLYD